MMQRRASVLLLLGVLLLLDSAAAASPPGCRDRDDPPPVLYPAVPTSQKAACSGAPVNCPKPSRDIGAISVANLCEAQIQK